MLRLSKKTDCTLLALQYLAGDGASDDVSARTIAERSLDGGRISVDLLDQHQVAAYDLAHAASAVAVNGRGTPRRSSAPESAAAPRLVSVTR